MTIQAGRDTCTGRPAPLVAPAGLSAPVSLTEDFHVHSLFSDGTSTVAENVRVAIQRGLTRICIVDHVRRETDWVPRFAWAVQAVREVPGIEILAGVEAKILDRTGRLDLPADLAGIDLVLIADHQFPADLGPVDPWEMRAAIRNGDISPRDAINCLTEATINALGLVGRPVLAHLFGVLPKIGLAETDVPDLALRKLADAASETGALVEVNEKWACPSPRTLRAFASAGVPLVASSDSHDCRDIGLYESVTRTVGAVYAGPA
ncbi:MAG: PHP domain-containing protein [Actinomycetota bacterium]